MSKFCWSCGMPIEGERWVPLAEQALCENGSGIDTSYAFANICKRPRPDREIVKLLAAVAAKAFEEGKKEQ